MQELTHIEIPLSAATLAGKRGMVIRPSETLALAVALPAAAYPVRYRLRVVGEVDIFWPWRCEPGMPLLYRSIADALAPDVAPGEKYALHLRGAGETWPRNAYVKLSARALPRALTFAVLVKADALALTADGEAVVELGIYRARDGRHPDDGVDPPDAVIRLALPAGTYDWKELSTAVTLPEDAVTLLVRVGGRGFAGQAWLGSPRLFPAGGETVIPPLMPDQPHAEWQHCVWLGENLSRLEQPEFALAVDGEEVFRGPRFNGIFRAPDFEIPLPALAAGTHALALTLRAAYPTALPFVVQRAEVLRESARPVEIVGYPEYVAEGQPFAVLVERNAGAESRLEAVAIEAGPARPAPEYTLRLDDEEHAIRPTRVVRRAEDGVLLSTGDAVYIPQEEEAMLRYLAWYVAHRLGNAVCFRPVYRWSGTRAVNPAVWARVCPLLEELRLKYALMVDGRELSGCAANPDDALLAGPNYLGRQAHEADGAFNYWGSRQETPLFADIMQRGCQPGGIQPAVRPAVRERHRVIEFFDPSRVTDMRQGAEYFVENLRRGKGASTRHTGPSVLFHYFYAAGYDWLGAEQMYGPEEVILAALRGASRARGKSGYGAHLAVQWSSAPQDTPAHAARYFLSLATCYLHGVTHINTEEGLWRMESEYAPDDRFSHNCAIHRAAHTQFRRFVETHPRRGVQRVPLAVLQGRNDGWRCFGRGSAWGAQRDEFAFGTPEESFDLLRVYYPRSVLDAVYRNASTDDRPEGWYTGTPYGAVDLAPVTEPAALDGYRALAFLGWNTFAEEDFARLLAFVEGGGTLLLARPHLSTEVRRNQPAALPAHSPALARLLGDAAQATEKVVRTVGQGKVIYFPQESYPCADAVRADYEGELAALGELAIAAEAPRGWVRGTADVNFTAYDWAEGRLRTLYLLNIDHWSGAPAAPAELLFGGDAFPLAIPTAAITVITAAAHLAVQPLSPDADILDITARHITVQSDAGVTLRLFHPGQPVREISVTAGGVQEVAIEGADIGD